MKSLIASLVAFSVVLGSGAAFAVSGKQAKSVITSTLNSKVGKANWSTHLYGKKGDLVRPFVAKSPLTVPAKDHFALPGTRIVQGNLYMNSGKVSITEDNTRRLTSATPTVSR
jgi:hypothetical protein